MRKSILIVLLLISCSKSQQVYQPVGTSINSDLQNSQIRAKQLNIDERKQIQIWIDAQDQAFYSMGLNYWISMEHLNQRNREEDGRLVSYQYDLYDFDWKKLYQEPVKNQDVVLGRFKEIKAIEDAIRYMKKGEEATLLIPSVLAFGTYGDGDQISNDMPLIVKLKRL